MLFIRKPPKKRGHPPRVPCLHLSICSNRYILSSYGCLAVTVSRYFSASSHRRSTSFSSVHMELVFAARTSVCGQTVLVEFLYDIILHQVGAKLQRNPFFYLFNARKTLQQLICHFTRKTIFTNPHRFINVLERILCNHPILSLT